MKLAFLKSIAPILLASALIPFTPSASAQTQTNKPSGDRKSSSSSLSAASSSEKKQTAGPFHGKLIALDKTAKTITVGKRTFHVTPETKIIKNEKPATINDGVVDDVVSGYFKTSSDGKLTLTTLRFGPKTDSKTAEKKKKA